jgi:NTE family protein
VLSVLLPALDDRRLRPTMFVGTSAGAINAALFASLAHLPAEAAAQEAINRWLNIRKSMVMRPALYSLPKFGLRYAASLLGLRADVSSLLDTSPLLASLNSPELIDWGQLQDNLNHPRVLDTVAVVTTQYGGGSSGRSKVFYSSARHEIAPPSDNEQALDYVPTELTAEHVRASAAIPGAFPPVRLGNGANARWHMDGGVRLNAPLKPAITLGAARLVMIATDPARFLNDLPGPAPAEPPPMQDAIDQVLHGAMSDRMIEDLQNVRRVNLDVAAAATAGASLKSSSGREYRHIPVIFGDPPVIDDLGRAATRSLSVIMHGIRKFANPDLLLLNFLLGSSPGSRGDLLSYLLFEPEFIRDAISLGQQHADNLIAGGLW